MREDDKRDAREEGGRKREERREYASDAFFCQKADTSYNEKRKSA